MQKAATAHVEQQRLGRSTCYSRKHAAKPLAAVAAPARPAPAVAIPAPIRGGTGIGSAPPLHVADEHVRARLSQHLSQQLHSPVRADEYLVMRGPHGTPPGQPLDHTAESLKLLGPDCGHSHGVVRRILFEDGGVITLRPQLRGPVSHTVITKAKVKWQRPVL